MAIYKFHTEARGRVVLEICAEPELFIVYVRQGVVLVLLARWNTSTPSVAL